MYKNIEGLMAAVGCEKWPQRWADIYQSVMDKLLKYGCELTDPDYYDGLGEKYNVLVKHRDIYKKAAEEVAKSEALTAFLTLLCESLADAENRSADLKELSRPKSPDGKPSIAHDMITGLAICSQMEYSYNVLKKRGLPDDVIVGVLRMPENGIYEYMKRNGGNPGYHLLSWFQLAIDGRLFRIGRLEIEFLSSFGARAKLFKSADGERVALAHDIDLHRSGIALGSKWYEDEDGSWHADVEETDAEYIGHPFDKYGAVKREKLALKKSEWTLIAEKSTPAIRLHIPADGRLTPDLVDETLEMTREFVRKYFPEYVGALFVCHSWLLDPQLVDLLGEESNISKFCKRFTPMTSKSGGNAVFGFVFLGYSSDCDLNTLPENTSLERLLKNHYINSRAIYELHGYFPFD